MKPFFLLFAPIIMFIESSVTVGIAPSELGADNLSASCGINDGAKLYQEQSINVLAVETKPQSANSPIQSVALKPGSMADLPKFMTEDQCMTYAECAKVMDLVDKMITLSDVVIYSAKRSEQDLIKIGRSGLDEMINPLRNVEQDLRERIKKSPRIDKLRKNLRDLEVLRGMIGP